MSAIPLILEVVTLFLVVLYLLNKYSNIKQQNVITLIGTFIAWYFSFIIVFLLPMDISMTTYRQCLKEHQPNIIHNSSDNIVSECKEPYSLVPSKVFPVLWRIIYWSSQALTWLILPFMQSFSQSGEFSLSGKIKGALISNAIYYGTYLAIFGVLLIYVAVENNIDGQKLKVIGITASNTWGLFLLVLLLGYGLVAVPRSLWYNSITSHNLKQLYFKIAKLYGEKCEAEENLEDMLNDIKQIAEKIKYNHPLRSKIDIIVKKCPESFRNTLRRNIEDYNDYNEDANSRDMPSEKQLINLHARLIKLLQINNRTLNQWSDLVEKAFLVEDILVNEKNTNRKFVSSTTYQTNILYQKLCNPRLEWLYYCFIKKFLLKLISVFLTGITLMVIWSEMTFFNKKPVLSIFAIFLNAAQQSYNYVLIEIVGIIVIAYLCFCAYYAIFKMRIFNYYYLTPNHHTNEYSLIFSGTLVCRLTSPLCYNFLGLVHLDSHITKDENIVETEFTSLMGHMDVISFISDGFNIYFPMLILVLCLATFFNLGGRILNYFGFEQFIGDADVTQDLIEDGKNLVRREKRRIQRDDPEAQARHREVSERLRNNYSTSSLNRSGSSNFRNVEETSAQPSTSSVSNSAFDSVKNVFINSLPSFMGNKSNIKIEEYRDIPPYTDNPDGTQSDFQENDFNDRKKLINPKTSLVKDDNLFDSYDSTRKTNESNRLQKPKNIRSIFDDV